MKRTLLASVAAIQALAAAVGIFHTRFQNIGNAHAENAPVTSAAAPGNRSPKRPASTRMRPSSLSDFAAEV